MAAAETIERQHYWDVVRGFLILLGIPYHAALPMRAGKDWIVAFPGGSPVLTYVAEFIHLFRMPAFFLVAGYFAALMLTRREPGGWLRSRIVRLGLPLAASLLTIVPLMNLACELSNFALPEALASWRHESSTSGGYWVRHLWFIIVLLYLTIAATGLAALFPAIRDRLLSPARDALIARRLPLVLIAIALLIGLYEAAAIEGFYMAGLNTNLLQQILRLDELIMYAPYFVLGCILQRSRLALAAFTSPSVPIAIVALLSMTLSLILIDRVSPATGRFIGTLTAIATTQVVVSAARWAFDRPIRMIERIVAASFVIYLFHMPILIALVTIGQSVAMPVWTEFTVVVSLTLLLSYGIWLVVERSPLLRALYDGVLPVAHTPGTPPPVGKYVRAGSL